MIEKGMSKEMDEVCGLLSFLGVEFVGCKVRSLRCLGWNLIIWSMEMGIWEFDISCYEIVRRKVIILD